MGIKWDVAEEYSKEYFLKPNWTVCLQKKIHWDTSARADIKLKKKKALRGHLWNNFLT